MAPVWWQSGGSLGSSWEAAQTCLPDCLPDRLPDPSLVAAPGKLPRLPPDTYPRNHVLEGSGGSLFGFSGNHALGRSRARIS
jgi:hypothetical protein